MATLGRLPKKGNSERLILSPTKPNIDRFLLDVLLQDDMALLDAICKSSSGYVGDSAAVASKGILKILFTRLEKGQTEDFIKKALRHRVMDYRSKSRDMSDITRDNSLITMLLTAYSRSEGQAFLSQTLTKPLNSVYSILSKCEVDGQKLNKGNNSDPGEIEKEIEQNRGNLEHVCKVIFQNIFDSRSKIPESILGMCSFLFRTIEEIMQIDPSTFSRRGTFSEGDKKYGKIGPGNIPRGSVNSSYETPGKAFSTHLASILINRGRAGSNSSMLVTIPSVPNEIENSSVSAPISPRTRKIADKAAELSEASAALDPKVLLKPESTPNGGYGAVLQTQEELCIFSPTPPTELPHPNGAVNNPKVPEDVISGTPDQLKNKISNDNGGSIENHRNSTSPTSTSGTYPFLSLQLSVAGERKEGEPILTKNEKMGSSTMGTLEVNEKIIGSFLFLRFIVPGITTPETNGIMIEKISPQARRGLVLCGKMLTALCNDTEFGYKETSLMPCNHFLAQFRHPMKLFLSDSSTVSQGAKELQSSILQEYTASEMAIPTMIKTSNFLDAEEGFLKALQKATINSSEGNLQELMQKKEFLNKTKNSQSVINADSSVSKDNEPEMRSSSPIRKVSKTTTTTRQQVIDRPGAASLSLNTRSRSIDNLRGDGGGISNEPNNVDKLDPDIYSFLSTLHGCLEKVEKEMSEKSYRKDKRDLLVRNMAEARVYLHTAGYVPESSQSLEKKKHWWEKMMRYLTLKEKKT